MKICLNGRGGKVGRVLAPALEEAGHELVELEQADAMVDFTAPEAAPENVRRALEAGVPCVVGTTGWDTAELGELARESGLALFFAPNFALGAVLMMRLAEEASRYFPHAEIVELHDEKKVDAPSGTSKATAARLPGDPPIHSVRLPGLVSHQEVLFGADAELLTIRHDAFSHKVYVAGVLLALERLPSLPAGLTTGLDSLLE